MQERNIQYIPKFDEVSPINGESYMEAMTRVLKKRILPHFDNNKPFNGVILDVGSRDGRFINMIKELGAEKVVAVEPDVSGVSTNELDVLKNANLFNGTVEALEEQGKKYDGAVVLNCSPMANPATMIPSIARQVVKGGVVIFSFVEQHPTYGSFIPYILANFKEVQQNGAFVNDSDHAPHKVIVIARK